MAGVTTQTCPYCKTRSVSFVAKTKWTNTRGQFRALFTCGSCAEGVIWEYVAPGGHHPDGVSGDLGQWNIFLGLQWPKPPLSLAPADTPATVSKFFEQGVTNLEIGHFDAAGMLFRKSLEVATKILNPDLSGKPLFKRIDALVAAGSLTSDMGAWAHEVRLGGNEAAHEDEPFTQEHAESLKNFLESFLTYSFTLPSAVKRRAQIEKVE